MEPCQLQILLWLGSFLAASSSAEQRWFFLFFDDKLFHYTKKDCNFNMELFFYVCDNSVIKHLTHAVGYHSCRQMCYWYVLLIAIRYVVKNMLLICLSQQYHAGRKATSWALIVSVGLFLKHKIFFDVFVFFLIKVASPQLMIIYLKLRYAREMKCCFWLVLLQISWY